MGEINNSKTEIYYVVGHAAENSHQRVVKEDWCYRWESLSVMWRWCWEYKPFVFLNAGTLRHV